jgi:hypothetical protein
MIRRIAISGLDVWDRTLPTTKNDRIWILKRYGIIFSNNQGAERCNKLQNNAASNQRGEQNTSKRVAALAQLCELCSAWVLGAKRVPFRGKERLEHVNSVIHDLDTQLEKQFPQKC